MSATRVYRAELHIHTVLSPCAEVEMIPPLIIQEATDLGINLLGITDHNASANVESVMVAAKGSGIHVLPGMELQTHEEVHLLCLFDTLDQLREMQKHVDQNMPDLKNRPDYFGEQFVVDSTGDFICREDKLLLTSCSLTIIEACRHVNDLGGLLIPAHVDRQAFGLLPVLGLIPDELSDAVAFEVSRHINPLKAAEVFPQLADKTLIQSGDVHRLEEFLGVNYFRIEKPCVSEIKKAFLKSDGRLFEISNPNL